MSFQSFLAPALLAFAASAIPLHAQLLITEINSNGTGGDFWELTNSGTSSVDLSNYKWTDGARTTTGAIAVPAGTSIAAGESIVFNVTGTAATFRNGWGIPISVQVLSSGGNPGLGQDDGITLYDAANTEVLFLSYAAGGFTRSSGSGAAGGHAGASAGGAATVSLVLDPGFGTGSPRYAAAAVGSFGGFAHTTSATTIGSPGVSGLFVTPPTVTLSVSAAPSGFSESAVNPASSGTVSRTGATTSALVVSLSSSDTTEATVPASVTIPIGSVSAPFDIAAVNDNFPDGNKTVTLTASASGATAGTATLTVNDDGDVYVQKLMLTEVLSQQAASGVNDFWELTNISASAVSLEGYSWHDSGRSASAAQAYKLPAGSSIAPGESVIFTTLSATAFRDWWNIPTSVQVFQSAGAPGLGQNDGISFFDESQNEIFFFSYAAGGFTKSDGNPSSGTHSGPSAGAPTETQSAVWDPASGPASPRYTFATVGNLGAIASAANALDIASPGVTVGVPSVSIASAAAAEGNSGSSTLTLNVTRTDVTSAFTVDYAVTGGTANGADFTLAAGTLNFTAAGAATLPINITVNGDTDSEPDETVIVTLSNIINTTGTTILGTAAGTGTITNDDTVSASITTQPASTTITSGGTTTLTLVAAGSPAPTIQWYQGTSGNTATPVGTNSSTFVTPALTSTTSYWARVSNVGATVDSATATVTIVSGVVSVDLSTYVRVGRHGLPEPTRTALPPGTAAHNLLCQEASAVTYNWDTDTLFISCDGGRSITQVSKTGQLIDTMSLALQSGAPQGTAFYDPEGITYIGGGQFVLSEERDQQLVKFTYAAGTTLTRANAQTVDLGPFDDNTGAEGLSWDPPASDFIVLKEKAPIGVFRTSIDFTAGTSSNAPPVVGNEAANLFNTSLLGMSDVADVFAFTNIPSMTGQPQAGNLLVVGQENARIVNISRTGVISSTLNITADAGDTISSADMQHEGITMDRAGVIYVVNENGGGNINYPELWVYAPSTATNQAPTAVALNNSITILQENTSTASPVKVGDIAVTDDGLGANNLSLSGADALSFEITGSALYLKAGVNLDFETKTSYVVTISVDDATVGATPDVSVNFILTVTDQLVETPAAPALLVTEVSPWSSGNSPVGADWFEVTNVSDNPVTITGWKVDDSSAAFATALALNGITTIAAGESVIFVEGTAATTDSFKANWFGASPPSGLQVGYYSGSGIGLSTNGDGVNLFNAGGALQASVSFGAADATSPYQTFDNTVALNNSTISLLSVAGFNGAFVAANSSIEIGSPGYSAPGVLRVTEVAPWSSGNSPLAADWFEVTNSGARAVNIAGWKVDDSSESPAAALALNGVTSIAPGESVIFIETSNLTAARTAFLNLWFGANPPASLQIGSYSGGGIGLSTGGDAVNLFDTATPAVRRVNVSFGIAPSTVPFATFDNTVGVNVGAVTLKSVPGVNGAFLAANDANEVGSPGSSIISGAQGFAQWLSAKGYTSFGFGTDSDSDGITDGVEFFFNQNPNQGGDSGNLPQLVPNGGALEFDFTRLTNTGGVTGDLMVSGDLNTWTPALIGLDYTVASSVVTGDETAFTYALPGTGPSAPGTSAAYLTPNTSDPVGASLGGIRVVNEGLVGVGRLSGENLDQFGETQGAASGLFITDWAWNGSQFTGKFNVLPDRGYNSGTIFSNYAARLHRVDFTFSPYYGGVAVAEGQINPTYVSSTKFTYQDGATTKFTTGLNVTGTGSLFGQSVGVVTAANGPGGAQESLLAFDAEAVHLFDDGSGFVSDEYGTYIARFNAAKQITGITQLPESARPRSAPGVLNFTSTTPAPVSGRRVNQGLEGMSVTPDGTRLFAVMQSALVQDTNGGNQQTRNHTRLFVYDVAGPNRETPVLIGEYVVKLPQIDLNGNNSGLDGTAAQSEIVAIGHSSFLMLPRDGNGMGKGTTDPIVFKSVQLVDFSTATNILGTFDAEADKVSPAGDLAPGVNAAASAEIINMLEPTDLAKFGLNANTNPSNKFTLNEKMEGMALVPDLSTPQANDFFLFVANDNDFQSSNVQMVNAAGSLVSYNDGRLNAGITNDAMFYAYRITIDAGGKKFFRFGIK